jgi:serine/threonine protein kinase
LQGVGYCHKNGAWHRDSKPENLLLASTAPDAEIKIVDFGLRSRVADYGSQEVMKTRVGSP